MKDIVQIPFHINIFSNVVFNKSEILTAYKMGNIIHIPRDKIVHSYYFIPLLQ
ncbi:hypothetical protein ES703_60478 [subsurface metagenome]